VRLAGDGAVAAVLAVAPRRGGALRFTGDGELNETQNEQALAARRQPVREWPAAERESGGDPALVPAGRTGRTVPAQATPSRNLRTARRFSSTASSSRWSSNSNRRNGPAHCRETSVLRRQAARDRPDHRLTLVALPLSCKEHSSRWLAKWCQFSERRSADFHRWLNRVRRSDQLLAGRLRQTQERSDRGASGGSIPLATTIWLASTLSRFRAGLI